MNFLPETKIEQSNLLEVAKNLINELNKRCFDNQLQLEHIPLKLIKSSRISGQVAFSFIRFGKEKKVTAIRSINLSSNFNWTYQDLKNTICHELIHVYEIQILKQTSGHGLNFKLKMMKINSSHPDIKVSVRHNMSPIQKRTIVFTDKDITYIICENNKKIVFVHPSLEKRKNSHYFTQNVNSLFGANPKFGKVSYSKISRKFKLKRKFCGYYLLNDEIKQIIGNVS